MTGTTGFLGKRLYTKLKNYYPEKTIVTLSRSSYSNKNHIKADLTNKKSLNPLKELPIKSVYHCASVIPSRGNEYFRNNVEGLFNLLQILSDKNLKSFTLVSSVSVYGNVKSYDEKNQPLPDAEYGKSKLSQEFLLRTFAQSNLRWLIVRPSSMYGPGNTSRTVLPIFWEKVLRGEKIIINAPKGYKQNYIHIDDVVDGILTLNIKRKKGIFNLFGLETVDLFTLAKLIQKVANRQVPLIDESSTESFQEKTYHTKKIEIEADWIPHYRLETGLKTVLNQEEMEK